METQAPVDGAVGGAIAGLFGIVFLLAGLAASIFFIVSMWKVYAKAGRPGWGCLIPIYNLYLLLRMAGMSGWWLLACFVPLLNLVPTFMIPFGVAKNFEKGVGFGVGILLLPIVFYPILAFGEARFVGPPD